MDEFSKLAYKMADELGTLRGAISLLFAFGGQGYGPLDLSGEYVAVSSKALEYVRECMPKRDKWTTTSES